MLKKELSGDEAKSFVKEISLHHRVTGGFGFHETIEYVSWVMKNRGLKVSIDECPLDGEFKIWTWSFPTAWDVIDGKRSIAEIADALTFEYGWTTPELMYEFFSDLEKIGYVVLTSQ